MENKNWFYVAISAVGCSILSLLVSIFTYTPVGRKKMTFSLIDLLGGGKSADFKTDVLHQYHGPMLMDIDETLTAFLVIIAVAAMICAVVGLLTLRKQRPNIRQFILTIVGLVGVGIPSIILLVIVLFYGQYYEGTIGIGLAPIVGPIAMAVSIGAVIRRKNKVAEQLQKELQAKGMIWQAGDIKRY